jgi:hypothetical protein
MNEYTMPAGTMTVEEVLSERVEMLELQNQAMAERLTALESLMGSMLKSSIAMMDLMKDYKEE